MAESLQMERTPRGESTTEPYTASTPTVVSGRLRFAGKGRRGKAGPLPGRCPLDAPKLTYATCVNSRRRYSPRRTCIHGSRL
jgi:hypothetical protein